MENENNGLKIGERIGRLDWIDIAKGIAIVCTILGHSVSFGGRARNLIFSFHMPLFFLLSGYTIRQIPLSDVSVATKKDFKRLIIPVFIMRFINLLVDVLYYRVPILTGLWNNIRTILWGNGNDYGPLPGGIQMYGVGVLWFLIALFWAKLLYRVFDCVVKKYRFIILLACAFAGMWVGSIIRLPQGMDMMPLIMLFMECGRYLKENVDMNSVKWPIVGVISFLAWTYLVCDKGIYIEISLREYPHLMLCVLIAILGCIVIIQCSQGMEQLHRTKVLSFLGRNSLDLLCIHHIDGYFSVLWEISIFSDEAYFLNAVFTAIGRAVFDIAVLLIWVLIKEKVIKRLIKR